MDSTAHVGIQDFLDPSTEDLQLNSEGSRLVALEVSPCLCQRQLKQVPLPSVRYLELIFAKMHYTAGPYVMFHYRSLYKFPPF